MQPARPRAARPGARARATRSPCCCPTAPRCSSSTSPSRQAGFYLMPDQLPPRRRPRSPTSCRTREAKVFVAHERFADARHGRGRRDRVPRRRAASPSAATSPGFRSYAELNDGQPTDAARRPHDRRGHELHVGHDRAARRACAARCRASTPRPAAARLRRDAATCSGSSRTTTTCTSSARRCTTPRCWRSRARAMHLGHTVVLMDKWTPEEMLQLIEQYRVTNIAHGADAVPPAARAARGRRGASTTCRRCAT